MAYQSLLGYRYIDRRVSKKTLVFKGWRSVMIVDFIRHRLHTRPNVSTGTLSDKCYKKQAIQSMILHTHVQSRNTDRCYTPLIMAHT